MSHYDPDYGCMYKVVRVEFYKESIDGYREQCKQQNGYVVDVPTDDCISIEEIMKYTGCDKERTSDSRRLCFYEGDLGMLLAAGRATTGGQRRFGAGVDLGRGSGEVDAGS